MDTNNSINDYRETVTDNPYREMWNQLYYFTDVDSVNKKVRSRFQLGGEYKEDTKKQAQQIAYSIMQAGNYSKAAQEVDVWVKPNLIYYGISSLANTVILYNNDGSFSLDYLRENKRRTGYRISQKSLATSPVPMT